jgi:hypothetical protein
MAQTLGKLTVLKAAKLSKPGMYADGGGLYFQIKTASLKSWVFPYKVAGGSHMMGLSNAHTPEVVCFEQTERIKRAQPTIITDNSFEPR